MSRLILSILLFPLAALPCPALAQSAISPGIEQLHRLDLLPRLKSYVSVGSISSYDRSGGNDDGFSGKYSFVDRDGDGLVIADLKGPGVIYRIWTPTPTDDPIEFRFDGEAKPRIQAPFRELFTGTQPPFVSPLVGCGAGGFYCYTPLPFRQSCKITIRAERVQFYQVNYAIYPDDASITTWSAPPTEQYLDHQRKACELFSSAGADISAAVVPQGSQCTTHASNVSLAPGQSATMFETDTPGRIAGLRISPAAALAGKDRDLLLRIHWDGDEQPAVLCPAGDFFGYAWGRPAMTSLLVGTAGDTNYCYFPMPFDRSAKIELVSQRVGGPPVELRAEVVLAPVSRAADEGKFYALWRRENPTTAGQPFTFLETEGRGHIVGCVLQAQGMTSGATPFFEGDDQTTIDGRLAIHGTGSEDFFNGGWYDVPGRWESRLSFPLSGCLGYQKHLGRTGGYRLMLGDAYAFRESILQTIEHAPTGNSLPTDYCGMMYFYLDGKPSTPPSVPDVAQRRVVDFDRIVFTPSWSVPIHAFTFRDATISKHDEEIAGQRVAFFRLTGKGNDWVGPPFVSLVCEIPAAGRYKVSIEAVKGPDQARVQLFRNENPVGQAADLYSAQRERSPLIELGTLDFAEGPTNLMFKLVGKHEQATGLTFDLVTIQLDRVE